MRNQQVEAIQVLRFVAALVVVITHVWGQFGGTLAELLRFRHIGGLGVDVFFVISGFIMTYTTNSDPAKNSATVFLKKRVARIYPIYLMILTPIALYLLFRDQLGSVGYLIGNVLLLPGFVNDPAYKMYLPAAWTLVYEMFFYCIFAGALVFTKRKIAVD